jgi:hypothetical protein
MDSLELEKMISYINTNFTNKGIKNRIQDGLKAIESDKWCSPSIFTICSSVNLFFISASLCIFG